MIVDVWFKGFVTVEGATSHRYADYMCVCVCVCMWTHAQFDEISMVTLCLPSCLAQTINNSTVSPRHQRSFLNFACTQTHTCIHLLSYKHGHTPEHLQLRVSGNRLTHLMRRDQPSLNFLSQKFLPPNCCVGNCCCVIYLTPTHAQQDHSQKITADLFAAWLQPGKMR